MKISFIRTMVLSALTALTVALSPQALAQVTTSGMTGVVRGDDGQGVAGASVKAVYGPTNATFTATTNAEGRYFFRGLPPGGPFTVTATADGTTGAPVEGVVTQLGSDIDVNLLISSNVVQLEKFVVSSSRDALDSGATGSGSVLDSARLAVKPTSERSLADMVSANPLVTLRSTFGDREESQITAVGQNNRYNSWQIDGSRINDQFGLNGTGLASFFNPLSLDTIEQLAVSISPYDVRQSGFTGASINAVTKSGTNKFHGSAYYIFRGDEYLGVQLHGKNEREGAISGTTVIPKLERRTYGFTLGGPIIKDKLFFFGSYENFKSISAGRDRRFETPQEAQILARLQKYSTDAGKTIDWGNPVTDATTNTSTDKKYLGKIDWQINDQHRLSGRYTQTKGEVPQFGNFAGTTANLNGVTGGISTAVDGHFYSQRRKEETFAGQLVSQWTPSFKTELKYSETTQDQLTPLNTVAPMILITGLTGVDQTNGQTVTNGSYWAGTEQFRHGNQINVDQKQMSATADYVWNNFVFSGGFEREENDFFNLFRQSSFGLVAFRSLNDFLNDTNAVMQRNVFDPNVRDVADISEFTTNGLFAQARWDVNPRFNLLFGARYEFMESNIRPALNQSFLSATGFRNDGTVDGVTAFSPRVGFNLQLDRDRKTQLRGGFGHFLGRAPWVFFSNSFNATGVGSFTQFNTGTAPAIPAKFGDFLKNQFDPANPIGTAPVVAGAVTRAEVDFADNNIDLPQVWRGNLALEHKLPFLNSGITLEIVHTINDQQLFITNENLRPTSVGADGRQRFAGNPQTAANAKFGAFTDIFHVSNSGVGKSTFVTLQWDRPIRDNWGFNFSYTRGNSTEGQAIGQTTASGQWQRNVVFNQGQVEKGTSDFEIKDRIQLTLSRNFEFIKGFKTRTSLYYEGRTGNPYSWIYSSDLNGDGRTDNDILAVPSGPDDPRFDFSGLTSAQRDAYFAFLDSSGLSQYAGGIAPKNGFTEPWFNKLDIRLQQEVPIRGPAKLVLGMDWVNFGSFLSKKTFNFTEISPRLSNDVFRRRSLSSATFGTDGRIRPGAAAPQNFQIDNGMSRWRIQFTARLEF